MSFLLKMKIAVLSNFYIFLIIFEASVPYIYISVMMEVKVGLPGASGNLVNKKEVCTSLVK